MTDYKISIHASRGGSDHEKWRREVFAKFQSTLPAGEATFAAPLCLGTVKFQSTLPAGEATHQGQHHPNRKQFQSTLPAGEATTEQISLGDLIVISIHASRGGSDLFLFISKFNPENFNPRFPRGKRQKELAG